ncbi:hypothetical protein FRC06_009950, partial [Ceratobasidium sp. 370]
MQTTRHVKSLTQTNSTNKSLHLQTTIKLVQKSIPNLRSANLQDIFISTTFADNDDRLVLVSEEIWPEVSGHVKNIEVTLEDQPTDASHMPLDSGSVKVSAAPQDTIGPIAPGTRPQTAPRQISNDPTTTPIESSGSVSITIHTPSHRDLKFSDLHASTTIKDVKSLIETEHGIPAPLQSLELAGKRLDDMKTLQQSGVTDSRACDLTLATRQTMIYLFAPRRNASKGKGVLKAVDVQLSVDRAWELATLYPETSPKSFIQSVSWTVDVHEDGTLADRGSQTELSCLFWDGIPVTSMVIAPPLSSQSVKQ